MMKTLAFMLAVSVTLTIGAADLGKTNTTAKPPSSRPSPAQTRARLIEKYDLNKDGRLDKAEIEAMRKGREAEQLQKYDANKDGKLDDAERKVMREEQRRNLESSPAPKGSRPQEKPKK